MNFIVDNWLIFGGITLCSTALLFSTFMILVMRGMQGRIKVWHVFIYVFCILLIAFSGIPFVIGTIGQIIRFASKN